MATKSVKKIMDEVKLRNHDEVDLQDKSIVNVADIPHLCKKFTFSFLGVKMEVDSDKKNKNAGHEFRLKLYVF